MSATTVATEMGLPNFKKTLRERGSLLSIADQGGAALLGSTKATPVLLSGSSRALAKGSRLCSFGLDTLTLIKDSAMAQPLLYSVWNLY
jgi:hypothetical protein